MFDFLKRRKAIKEYAQAASSYVQQNYKEPEESYIQYRDKDYDIQYSDRGSSGREIRNEVRGKRKWEDLFNVSEVTRALRKSAGSGNLTETYEALERNVNPSFVDKLLYYINEKGVRDSQIYKAAHVDKRLFFKMVSNREYKPSKDTAIALALALELTLDEAKDMLGRAGYAFSHSSKRDIIIEYFFREGIYNLIDANGILYRLDQKPIGRAY